MTMTIEAGTITLSELERNEAIGWLEDCGMIDLDEAGITDPSVITDRFLVRVLDREYDGGFIGFRRDTGDVALSVREVLVAEYGDDWAVTVDHIASVVNSYRTDGEDHLVFNGAKANDGHGYDEAIDVSNYRVLEEAWSELEGFNQGPYIDADYISLVVDSPAPEDLIDTINALMNYPVLDDEEMSRVEMEMIGEQWESYGKSDTVDTVAKAIGGEWFGLTDAAEDIIETIVFHGLTETGFSGGYPYVEDASLVNFNAEDVAEWIKVRLGTVVTTGYQGSIVLDLRKHNLIAY